jgi:hypothetical protein
MDFETMTAARPIFDLRQYYARLARRAFREVDCRRACSRRRSQGMRREDGRSG